MADDWFKFYEGSIHDPKLLKLSDSLYRAWTILLCFASKNGGSLPPAEEIATTLREKTAKVAEWIAKLKAAGLFDYEDGRFFPHNWERRQYKVADPTAAERMQRYRKRKGSTVTGRNVTPVTPTVTTVTELRLEVEVEKEVEKEKEDNAPSGATTTGKSYAFEDGIIRLSERDFEAWRKAYSNLDLPAELLSLSKWAGSEGNNWFHALKGALAKRNREVKAAKERAAQQQPGGFKWNGMEGVI